METVAVFFSFHSNKTAKIGKHIAESFGEGNASVINAEQADSLSFLPFKNIILGVPTWFDGELPNYWDELVPAIEEMELNGKRFAIYGLGDQKGYPENFNDGVGIMAQILEKQGAEIIGFTSSEEYSFESSLALRGMQFCGLCLDQENQARLTNKRIENWVEQLKKEFY
jgi:flavodoxin I